MTIGSGCWFSLDDSAIELRTSPEPHEDCAKTLTVLHDEDGGFDCFT